MQNLLTIARTVQLMVKIKSETTELYSIPYDTPLSLGDTSIPSM